MDTVRLLSSILGRLQSHPRYKVSEVVRRRISLSPQVLSEIYSEGQCNPEKAFTSASADSWGDGYSSFASHSSVILAKNVANVAPFSEGKLKREKEVLFVPGTVFRVIKVTDNLEVPGSKKIFLEQCPCQPDI